MKILNDSDEINKLFKNQYGYTKEIVNSIKDFYFNEQNVERGSTKLENICHVSSNIINYYTKNQKGQIISLMNLFSCYIMIKQL